MATIFRGMKHKCGDMQNDRGQLIKYNTYTLFFTDDDDGTDPTLVGESCVTINANPDEFTIIGADDFYSLVGKPVMMIIDPTSIGVDSKGNARKPKLQALMALKPTGTPPSPATGDANTKSK